MINISVASTGVKEIDHGDPMFTIHSELAITRRAGIKISSQCPAEYVMILAQALEKGWVAPVAYVTNEEYLIMKLSN